ncbi:MAG: hypothetical protein HYX89_03895 [Chloroflexi bacterium]|nr:hypothetical protein [Chloroflexota bacterium]
MIGKFTLTADDVRRLVTRTSPGVYILSHDTVARYVGRSDTDVRQRLLDHIGTYRYFWFEYAVSDREAFYGECQLYHRYNPPDNGVHPAVPPGTHYLCPVCGR